MGHESGVKGGRVAEMRDRTRLIGRMGARFIPELARVEHDLTQAELAEKVGVTRQTISLIESGRYNPSLNLCLAIARVSRADFMISISIPTTYWGDNASNA